MRCKVSIVHSESGFGFFALKSTIKPSSKWVFVDANHKLYDDLEVICLKLREHLVKAENSNWSQDAVDHMNEYILQIEAKETNLLSNKKRRSHKLLIETLKYYQKSKEMNEHRRELINTLLWELDLNGNREEKLELNSFLETWIEIIQPILMELRSKERVPKVVSDLI